MKREQYSYAKEGNYSYFGDFFGGVVEGVGVGATWNTLAKYVSPAETGLLNGTSTYISDIFTSVEGIPVYLTDGTVGTPGLAWQNDRNSALYRLGSKNFGWSVDSTLIYDWNASRLKLATGKFLYLGASADLTIDVGDDYIATTDSVNGGLRGVIKNTSTGAFAYGSWSCVSDENNDVFFRINSTGNVTAGLHNTAGAAVIGMGGNGTSVGPGLRNCIIGNFNNDASSGLIFATRNLDRGRFTPGGTLCIGTSAASGSELLRVNGTTRMENALSVISGDVTVSTGNVLVSAGNVTTTASYVYAGLRLIAGASSRTIALGSMSGQEYLAQTNNVQMFFDTTNAAANAKLWDLLTSTTTFQLRAVNDANSAANSAFIVTRSGATLTSFVINEDGNDCDFRIEGDTATSLFSIDAGTDRISSTVSDTSTTPIYGFIQSSTGDAAIRFALASAHSYAEGIDNTDDAWKVSYAASGSAVLGTNDRLILTTGGLLGVNCTPAVQFEVLNASAAQIRLTNTSAVDYCDLEVNGDGDFFITPSGSYVTIEGVSLDVTGTTTAVYVSYSGAIYTGLQTDSSGNFLITPTGTDIDFVKSSVGSSLNLVFLNTDNTNGSSGSKFSVQTGGASGGDPWLHWLVTGVTQYSMGIDNSDSDKLKICVAGNLTAGDALAIKTSGVCEHNSDVTILDSAKGLVLKDTAGTPHYWRVTVDTAGVLTTTDLGTSAP